MHKDSSDKIDEKLDFLGDQQNSVEAPSADSTLACPAKRAREYVAPHNEVEAGVAEILARLLMIERVGINDNFLLLGGESLLAAQAALRIQNRFGCEVSLRVILTGNVSDIAAEILPR